MILCFFFSERKNLRGEIAGRWGYGNARGFYARIWRGKGGELIGKDKSFYEARGGVVVRLFVCLFVCLFVGKVRPMELRVTNTFLGGQNWKNRDIRKHMYVRKKRIVYGKRISEKT